MQFLVRDTNDEAKLFASKESHMAGINEGAYLKLLKPVSIMTMFNPLGSTAFLPAKSNIISRKILYQIL